MKHEIKHLQYFAQEIDAIGKQLVDILERAGVLRKEDNAVTLSCDLWEEGLDCGHEVVLVQFALTTKEHAVAHGKNADEAIEEMVKAGAGVLATGIIKGKDEQN